MSRHRHLVLERLPTTALVGAAVAYAVLGSFTRPFTWGADVVTAVPLAGAAVATFGTSRRSRRARWGEPAPGEVVSPPRGPLRWGVWIAPIAAIIGWELYCLVNLPRAAHPTLSSLLDIVDASRPGKAVVYSLWLALGWLLVTK